jgi:hypothetical protein
MTSPPPGNDRRPLPHHRHTQRTGRPRHQLVRRKQPGHGRRVAIIVVTLLAIGGGAVGAYFATGERASTETERSVTDGGGDTAPPDISSAQNAAKSVVALLNRRDLDGVIGLTCATGRNEGRQALIEAVPALDPAAAQDAPANQVTFALGEVVVDKPGEAVAKLIARQVGDAGGRDQDGEMLLLDEGDGWRLCGLSMSPPSTPPLPGPSSGDGNGTVSNR